MRPLGIPTMKDRAMQALYLLGLDPVAETKADPNSYGFRGERSCADAIEQCFNALAQPEAAQWVLEGDIKSCFDRISHEWLLKNIPTDAAVLRKWLKAGYVEKGALHPTEEGTPQGGVISPVLANMALDGLEALLLQHFRHSQRRPTKVHLIRYADDFVITGNSRELLETQVKPLVEQFLKGRGLELSPEKTTITHIEDGFDFLGQNVRKYGAKLLIKPSAKSVATFLAEVREVIEGNKQAAAGHLVWLLNPKIRGWANYHRHVVSKRTFSDVDSALFWMLWRWAKRRHPNKGRRWVKEKYFTTEGGDHWVFFGEDCGSDGKPRTIRLAKAAKTRIKRHIKIRAAANPYAPCWEAYLADRRGKRGSWRSPQRQTP
jgi:RNA-directed DNA polymerase